MNALLIAPFLALCSPHSGTIDLFDGKSLKGWSADVPERDNNAQTPIPFMVRDGKLVSLGTPMGHLITDGSYDNYRLTVEYRWPKTPGNSGIIVHVSKARLLNNFLPQGIEAQLMNGRAGDFHLFGESLFSAANPSQKVGRRFAGTYENEPGEWNSMDVECDGNAIRVSVNGQFANYGQLGTVAKGRIAIQSEGAEIEFRKVQLTKL